MTEDRKAAQEASVSVVPPQADDSFNLIEFLIVLAKYKKLVFGVPTMTVILSAGISLLLPDVYTATARILPPQQNQSMATAFLGQFGSFGGAAASSLGLKNPSELYVGMLQSRSVADSLIDQFKLQNVFDTKTQDDSRAALARVTAVTSGRDGIISIAVDDRDPNRAAALANGYVEQLEKMNERLAITEAAQRRLFFERQLVQQKDVLATAEMELKKTQEQTGLIKLDEQGKALIEAVAQVRAQIATKEVQIGSMGSFSTEQNPDRIRAEAELKGLRQQLRKLEQSSVDLKGGAFVPTRRVPEAGLEYVRKMRDVKYQETLFELLAKQYELARLDEAKDASIIQVLDRAVTPQRKSKPKRAQIVVVSTLAVGFLAIVLAFLLEAFDRVQADPKRLQRLRLFRSYLSSSSASTYL